MKAQGVIFASWIIMLLLAFALATCISSHSLNTWWKIEKSSTASKEFACGLYRVCMTSDAVNSRDRCYKFVADDMMAFVRDTMNLSTPNRVVDAAPISETSEARLVWIFAFIFILLTGIAFVVSVWHTVVASRGKTVFGITVFTDILTFVAGILGLCAISTAKVKERQVFLDGVRYLVSENLATGDVQAEGAAFALFCCSTAAVLTACMLALIISPLSYKHKIVKRTYAEAMKQELKGYLC